MVCQPAESAEFHTQHIHSPAAPCFSLLLNCLLLPLSPLELWLLVQFLCCCPTREVVTWVYALWFPSECLWGVQGTAYVTVYAIVRIIVLNIGYLSTSLNIPPATVYRTGHSMIVNVCVCMRAVSTCVEWTICLPLTQ